MISPPLGDFRHTIHIGSGGESDTFGDISFLQGKFHLLLPPRSDSSFDSSDKDSPEAAPFEFAAVCGGEASASASPLLKNAVSLPVIAGPRALTLPAAQAPPKPPRMRLEERAPPAREDEEEEDEGDDGGVSPLPYPRAPRLAAPTNGFAPEEGEGEPPLLSQAGSLLSLHVDLGPSILEDVLQVMEKHRVRGARQEILT